MGELRHRGQDHTGGATGLPVSVSSCGLHKAVLFPELMCFLSMIQECGGRVPVSGPAGSQAAQLPGQAAHRQGDRAGEDEEDGGSAAGTEPGRGRDRGAFDRDEVLRAADGMRAFRSQWLLLCKWKSGIKLPQSQLCCTSAFRAAHLCWVMIPKGSGRKCSL